MTAVASLKGKFIYVPLAGWTKIIEQGTHSVRVRPCRGKPALWIRVDKGTEIRDKNGKEVAK